MTRKILKNSLFIAAAMTLCFSAAQAKLKGLPLKSYKDYTLRKNNVESVKYMIYAAKTDGNTISKGAIVDFGLETFFDLKGNRIKEIVYHIETGAVEATTVWTYDENNSTVTEIRTNEKGEVEYRMEYIANIKAGTVLARKFETIRLDEQTTRENVLMYEELWTEIPKTKTLSQKKTFFNVVDGAPIRQSIKEYDFDAPYTLYNMMEEFSGVIDCTWLVDYNARLLKTTSKKTRKETIFNGDILEYSAKSKNLSKITTKDKNKILKNEIIYSYTFDKAKNWTELVQKEGDKPKFIVQRNIIYRP
ncbi:MAG: hypothetical protein LBD59_05560 [Prevotellaceae bacterium]|jgi:hypothetical protein|nr:hypothetical protein [Prevotellaceae bacterium]